MLSLAEEIGGYLLRLGQNKLVVFIVEEQQLFLPYLVNLTRYNLTDLLLVLVVQIVLFQFQNFGCQCLTEIEYGTPAEMFKLYLVGHLFAHFKIRVNLQCLRKGDLQVGILQFIIFHNGAVTPYFKIPLVGVDDDIIIFISTAGFRYHVAERLFQHADKRCFVDIFQLVEFGKCIYETYGFCLLSHILFESDKIFCILYFVIKEADCFFHFCFAFGSLELYLFCDRDGETILIR